MTLPLIPNLPTRVVRFSVAQTNVVGDSNAFGLFSPNSNTKELFLEYILDVCVYHTRPVIVLKLNVTIFYKFERVEHTKLSQRQTAGCVRVSFR